VQILVSLKLNNLLLYFFLTFLRERRIYADATYSTQDSIAIVCNLVTVYKRLGKSETKDETPKGNIYQSNDIIM
jgi:hypothetical protein